MAETDIAIIGMQCRFPGAASVDDYWRNLRNGVESIRRFTPDELLEAGVDPKLSSKPGYVAAGSVLDGIDLFDAGFFGYTATEAELMDPQQRFFLETAYTALEYAGYGPRQVEGVVGVYGGCSSSTYMLHCIIPDRERLGPLAYYQAVSLNDKDFLASKVAYKLDLTGPAINVQTGCSTSLVAVHLACQALLGGECDVALAGGVSISVPQTMGYLHQDGMIFSPDGHCRPFDARAQGTIGGSGAGLVVLKRLDDALADRDSVYAVIKGSAVNNDGAVKVGYMAPGVDGQTAVIREALTMADIDATTISYVETHGTATPLGDTIEIAALMRAFRSSGGHEKHCALGSVKSNFGHLDTAAGIAGLIKTVLALHHGEIPPSLHFETPNPDIDMQAGPFFVNTHLRDWQGINGIRRAGVSSFGIGGTNAHLVLEEAPPLSTTRRDSAPQLLVVSAAGEEELRRAVDNLGRHLKNEENINLADVAYTLQVGREHYSYRRALVCTDRVGAIAQLEEAGDRESAVLPVSSDGRQPEVVFLISGTTVLSPEMGQLLAAEFPQFQKEIENCLDQLPKELREQLRSVLFTRTTLAHLQQQALFLLEFSLASLLVNWGIEPVDCVGVGVGQAVAACLKKEMSLEEGMALAVEAVLHPLRVDNELPVTDTVIPGEIVVLFGSFSEKEVSELWHLQGEKEVVSVVPAIKKDQVVSGILASLGKLWCSGVYVDWQRFGDGQQHQRIPLPAYPFSRQRYWFEPLSQVVPEMLPTTRLSLQDWFTLPTWKRCVLPAGAGDDKPWLLFGEQTPLVKALVDELRQNGNQVFRVSAAEKFQVDGPNTYGIRPDEPHDYVRLFSHLGAAWPQLQRMVHLWSIAPPPDLTGQELSRQHRSLTFSSLLYLATACQPLLNPTVSLVAVGSGLHDVSGNEHLDPASVPLLAAIRVIPQEIPAIRCRSIDLETTAAVAESAELLARELRRQDVTCSIALRGGHPWMESYQSLSLPAAAGGTTSKKGGSYLLIGGLGRLGLHLAEHLAVTREAKLVLLSRSVENISSSQQSRLQRIREKAAVLEIVEVDVTDGPALENALAHAEEQFEGLDAIFYLAGVTGSGSLAPLAECTEKLLEGHFQAKVDGVAALAEAVQGRRVGCCILFSSLSALLGGVGFASYSAANLALDALVHEQNLRSDIPWLTINWDGWADDTNESVDFLIRPQEGMDALERLLTALPKGQVLVSTRDLGMRLKEARLSSVLNAPGTASSPARHQRPALDVAYSMPSGEVEEVVTQVWQDILGLAEIGRHDDFFDLGGHSLLAIQVVAQLNDRFHTTLPVHILFEEPTVETLSQKLCQAMVEAEGELDKLSRMLDKVEEMSEEDLQAILDGKEDF
ncbi:type I polyketide synthase [Desulfopila sp. IMCC35008]|uniref:type I polyketide synthase n=1 Tax=Desulfopila sp. IMCC35008 TaxID=2653858 RepID=UPI0013D5984D|nr:type I polyketide synthase [Desulfopila sp. IMCC35008]